MTNPTNPFNWQMPTSSDLVTDLPADFETFGQAVATSMADLLGGTSGQVLSKATNTDMDFTWTTPASGSAFVAGKNKIINGDFGIWQRGTSFSNPANGTYTADRWFVELDGTGFTRTISQQTFTPGTAPVAGYEGQFFYRWNNSVAGTGNTINALSTRLEDMRTFAGQTVTFSFWAKADASRVLNVYAYQQSTGGSGTVTTTVGTATLTTSWARYTMTVAIPSLSGITIGTNSNLQIRIAMPTGTTMTCDFWGMQMEANSTATNFSTASQTIQGELALCQRYFQNTEFLSLCHARATTTVEGSIMFPVTMRVAPTLTAGTAWQFYDAFGNGFTQSSANGSLSVSGANTKGAFVSLGNFTGLTQGRTYAANAAGQGSFTLSAEL